MKNFSLKRMAQVMRITSCQNYKWLLNLSVAYLLAHFVGQALIFYTVCRSPVVEEWYIDSRMHSATGAFVMISVFLILGGISFTFEVLKEKNRRIAILMLPASNAEKFVARLLLCTVGVWLLNAVCVLLGDGLRQLIFLWSENPLGSALPSLWEFLVDRGTAFVQVMDDPFTAGHNPGWWSAAFALAASFMTYSFFLLGSAVFRKQAFILTGLCGVAITMAVAYVAGMVAGLFEYSYTPEEVNEFLVNVVPVMTIAEFLLGVGFVWLSYRLFTHMTVVRRKLF